MEICVPNALDLFQRPQIQTAILKTEEVAHKPLTSLDNHSSIEFLATGLNDTYMDLSSATIRLVLQILNKNGTAQVKFNSAKPDGSQVGNTSSNTTEIPFEFESRVERETKVKI